MIKVIPRILRNAILNDIKCIPGKRFRSQNTGGTLRVLNEVQTLERKAYMRDQLESTEFGNRL